MKKPITAVVLMLLVLIQCKASQRKAEADKKEGLTGGILVFEDNFDREALGEKWVNHSGRWKIRDGKLSVKGDRNQGLWLDFQLPYRARVEFQARALDEEGDLKCEIFASKPQHETGYIVIFGGWQNSISVLARLNEHGEDRLESPLVVEKNRWYQFALVRISNSLRWYLDGNLVLEYRDDEPLQGPWFAFNNWNSQVEFDNLKIFEL